MENVPHIPGKMSNTLIPAIETLLISTKHKDMTISASLRKQNLYTTPDEAS